MSLVNVRSSHVVGSNVIRLEFSDDRVRGRVSAQSLLFMIVDLAIFEKFLTRAYSAVQYIFYPYSVPSRDSAPTSHSAPHKTLSISEEEYCNYM